MENLELITECLNLKKISVGRDFEIDKESVIPDIWKIRKSRIKKDKFYLYFILMRDFFLHRFAYQDFHDFLWLKFSSRLSSSFSSQINSIRTRLFEDLKKNFKNYMKKIEKFFYTKLQFLYDEVENIIFFIWENKKEILNYIEVRKIKFFYGLYTFFKNDDFDYIYFQINCLQKRLSV